jgi:hypothetical protein
MASPIEPPICRKNVRLPVATPSRLKGTEAWTTMVKTESVGPTPRPVTNIHAHITGRSVSACRFVKRTGHGQRAGDIPWKRRCDSRMPATI